MFPQGILEKSSDESFDLRLDHTYTIQGRCVTQYSQPFAVTASFRHTGVKEGCRALEFNLPFVRGETAVGSHAHLVRMGPVDYVSGLANGETDTGVAKFNHWVYEY